jgi:hypothetical protein
LIFRNFWARNVQSTRSNSGPALAYRRWGWPPSIRRKVGGRRRRPRKAKYSRIYVISTSRRPSRQRRWCPNIK